MRWCRSGFNRRTLLNGLKKVAIGAAVAAGTAAVGGAAILRTAERSLQKNGQDELFKIDDDNKVQVSFQEFKPANGIVKDPHELVLNLQGAPQRAKASTAWGSMQYFADKFGAVAITADARPQGNFTRNSIDLEVEGLRRLIAQKGIKKITISGHSIGALKAVKLAVALQEHNPDIQINGLVLISPMGLYKQDAKDLLFNRYPAEMKNATKGVPPTAPKEDPKQVLWQMAGSIGSEIASTRLAYPKLVKEQIQALTQVDPDFSKVKSPVVLLVGKEDQVAQVKGIFPEAEIQSRVNGSIPQDTRERMALVGQARKQYLKEKVFPNAANLEVIEASKDNSGHGAYGYRADQATTVISKIFQRLSRPNTGVNAR